jgi:transcriptional regulator with XRE-family HTH domain
MRSLKEDDLPLPVTRALIKLGQDISYARRRRQMPQAMLAERIGTSVVTIRRLEAGNPKISLSTLARALHVFGELEQLKQLLDSTQDSIGLTLMDRKLPKRVHTPKLLKDSGAL